MMSDRLRKPAWLTLVPTVWLLCVTFAYGQQVQAGAKAWPDAFPKKGVGGVPESVDKLTIAVDSWGTSELNPWALTGVSFLGDYYN
jgi:carbon starvation protein CstA